MSLLKDIKVSIGTDGNLLSKTIGGGLSMSMVAPVDSGARSLPNDLNAEMATIGGMLISQEAVAEVFEEVRAHDFYAPKHEFIFNAILNLFGKGEPTDVIAVTDELGKTGNLIKAGGADYLHTLASYVPTAASSSYYASIVSEKAVLRRLIEAGTRIAQSGYDSQGEVSELVNDAQSEIFKVASDTSGDDFVGLNTSIEDAIHEMELAQNRGGELTGIATGFTELDQMTHGLHGGQLVILAARPAMGKSTLALDIARHASVAKQQSTLFFSLEMGRAEIAMRLLSAESSTSLQSMRKGMLAEKDWSKIAATRGKINDAPLYIDDSPNMTLVEIRAKCRRLAQQTDLNMVVIDYLQLLTSGKKVESRQQEVSEFSRALKLLAKELGVPVIAISQLNRQTEQSKDKKPELSHLRESGSLEQDADVVVLLHREGVFEKDHPRAGEADLILAKQRNGPTGTVVVAFQGHYSRFMNMQR